MNFQLLTFNFQLNCQDELGLNWDSFKYRNYDNAIGRFMSVDPLAEKYPYNSTYAFQENKLGLGRELEGLELEVRDENTGVVSSGPVDLDNNPNLTEVRITDEGWDESLPAVEITVREKMNILKKQQIETIDKVQNVLGNSATGFSILGEIAAYEKKKELSKLVTKTFDILKVNDKMSYVDEFGKIWTTNNPKQLISPKKLSYFSRYSNSFGKLGAIAQTGDIGISFYKGFTSNNSEKQLYYISEGFMKTPSYVPLVGTIYSVSFEPIVRPLWEAQTKAYRKMIKDGSDPSIIFIMPGLGYCPP